MKCQRKRPRALQPVTWLMPSNYLPLVASHRYSECPLYASFILSCTSVTFVQSRGADIVPNMLFVPSKASRRSQRQWIAVPVRIQVGGLGVDGVTINVSEHGLYLFAATNLSVGTQIEIVYCPPGRRKTVCACGIVQRKAVFLYGIEYLNDDTAPVGIATYTSEELG